MLITMIVVCSLVAVAGLLKYLIDVNRDIVITETRRDLQLRPIFKRAGKTLRLKYSKHGIMPGSGGGINYSIARLRGTIDGIDLEVHAGMGDDSDKAGSILIRAGYTADIGSVGHFTIFPERSGRRRHEEGGVIDFAVGDETFDKTLRVEARNPRGILALLDGNVRKRLTALSRQCSRFRFNESGAEVNVPADRIKGPDELVDCIELVALIGKNLSLAGDVRKMLMGNIEKDPVAAVRVANIEALAADIPLDEEVKSLLEKNLGDDDLDVQIAAARHLGDDGMRHLASLLERGDELGESVVLRIVSAAGANRSRESVPVLIKYYAAAKNSAIKIAILKAMDTIGDGGLAPFLLDLVNDGDAAVAVAAIEALGSCGTVESVERLYCLLEGSLSKHAGKAIAAIQARLGDVEKGWLSAAGLAEKEGALSRADGPEEGSLSREEKNENGTTDERR